MENRAYSLLEIKQVDTEERVIEGIASTPTTDRLGDIIEPMGAKFALPMPLLHQHNHSHPVGHVEFAQPTEKGIPFKARLARIDEPGALKDRVDLAWQEVKSGLVRAVSIGFRLLEDGAEVMKGGGFRIKKWEWMELSLVTIPANAEATILQVKTFDRLALAGVSPAEGEKAAIPQDDPPAASGNSVRVVKLDDPARDRAKPFVIKSIKRIA
ncbi:HK97 family phage prohead protease [Sphingomicrobium sp. XHP0239]|uniref:HK97 family phage prohead protease n=1 Tax=Sphingomicrobium maritimum TaxID=3133972 RepID=UPI0031CC3EA9